MPGNIRELENVLERTILFSEGPTILPPTCRRRLGAQPATVNHPSSGEMTPPLGTQLPSPSAAAAGRQHAAAER